MASALMEGLLRVINPDAYGADIVTAAVERNERYVGEYRTVARVAEDRFRVAEERLARAEAELAEAHEQAAANLATAGDWQARWNDEVHAQQRAEAENAHLREDLEALARRAEAAEAIVERAFAYAVELERAGLVFEADTLRDRLKDRS